MAEQMNVVTFLIEEITPYYNNPRNNEKAIEAVARSIQEFGWKKPIIVDENHEILSGHTRRLAALRLGLKEVPCVVVSDLDDAQKRAFRLADNRTSEFSQWDEDLLKAEMQKVVDTDFGEFGFDVGEVEAELHEDIGVKTHKCPRCGCEWTARDL